MDVAASAALVTVAAESRETPRTSLPLPPSRMLNGQSVRTVTALHGL